MFDRPLNEDEKKPLKELLRLTDRQWQNEDLFRKSWLWQNLRWDEPTEQGEDPEEDDSSVKSMWFQVQMNGNPDLCSWYTVPVTDPPESSHQPLYPSKVLSPVPGLKDCDLQRAVAFPPNFIIGLGGSYRPHSTRGIPLRDGDMGTAAKWIDVSYLGEGWQDWPIMKAARDFPSAVVVDGYTYVFGGVRRLHSPGGSFAEVYCPEEGEWKEIHFGEDMRLLYAHIPGGLFTDEEGHRHLLFRSDPHQGLGCLTSMYTFDLDNYTIDVAETPFPDLVHGAVVVDGFLLAYLNRTGDIRGYDIGEGKWIHGPVVGLGRIRPHSMLRLVPIDGKRLCVIYEDHDLGREEGDDQFWVPYHSTLRFIVTVFQVEKNNDGGGLVAKIFSSRCFRIPQGVILRDCLII